MAEIKYDTFKGSETIGLPMDEEGKYYFTFGKKKAKLILDYLDEIKAFAEGN